MATAVQTQATAFQYISKDDLLAAISELPDIIFNAFLLPAKATKQSKIKYPTQEEIEKWADSLPVTKLTPEQSESFNEGIRDIEEGRCEIMTVDELMEEVTS